MKTLVFAVLDLKIGTYASPFFMPTVASAKRAFAGAANDPGTMLFKHPDDFALYHLGEFDDESGQLTACLPDNLGLAVTFQRKES